MRAIILAGGKGTRLRPYTITLPKPLVPVGGEIPIIEIIIRQLSQAGFTHITMAVNHMAQLIMAFCGDGSKWNIKIDYSFEDKPLSTIGPLTLIKDLPENFLVMNGDILSDIDYRHFINSHIRSGSEVTVSTYRRSVDIDFGVLGHDVDGRINAFREKPKYDFDVSMGIYALNRRVVDRLKTGEAYGFDTLMTDGVREGRNYRVVRFDGFWLDLGRPEDFDTANLSFNELKIKMRL